MLFDVGWQTVTEGPCAPGVQAAAAGTIRAAATSARWQCLARQRKSMHTSLREINSLASGNVRRRAGTSGCQIKRLSNHTKGRKSIKEVVDAIAGPLTGS